MVDQTVHDPMVRPALTATSLMVVKQPAPPPRPEADGRIVFGCVYVALCLLAILIPVKVWGAERADACMAVGLDVSGSIHNEELRLQYDGLAAALIDQRFIRAVETGRHGMIAVTVYTWADSHDSVEIIVPWMGVTSSKDAQAIAEVLQSREVKHMVRSTSLLVALQAGTELLQGCPWFADRQLLNIAGDGYTNIGPSPLAARNAAIDRGIVINGLVVGEDPTTIEHYDSEVIGPTNVGFFVTVADYQAFARAMLNKFLLEISWNWNDWITGGRRLH